MDMKGAIRQIPVDWAHRPPFRYAFHDLIVVSGRLSLSGGNASGFWCSSSAAVENANVHATFRNAVITPLASRSRATLR